MALVTVLGVWPAGMLVAWLLNPLLTGVPSALKALLSSCCIVILLTWVIMPALVKILRRWL